ncbi:hypothetical protein Sme01_37180 [Sphaerisporangium melleum]|uniref:Uncharacterized protein n=1 Tax=Sphaerisporangium melleum TaxID=321316 RepID=A0A917RBM3_9ACTN|nr:hypothetical protein GCM10007964_47900 [Sphaerisporangium melleum]GII71242.1 hypothetical protein Sme01_37180 [Sphaerisporangium melleum]
MGGNYGTKAVPTYVTAEAETAPLPKITVEEPPPPPPARRRRSVFSRLGDLPMRVIYRGVAGAVVALALVVAAVVYSVTGWSKGTPTAAGRGEPPRPAQPVQGTQTTQSTTAGEPSAPAGVPATSGAAPVTTPVSVPSASTPSSSTSASPVPTPAPEVKSALATAKADPRIPAPPAVRKLANYPGHGAPTKGRVKDRRSGISFPRFAKAWKLTKSAPFATRRVLPMVKRAGHRGLLVSCPVPIAVQDELRDTAYVAARWTLNYHPRGATITWTASQAFKAGKRKGWLLGYRVKYKAGGDKHVATAAVALVEVPSAKPAMVFITIPDAQKKRWADINTLMSGLRPL